MREAQVEILQMYAQGLVSTEQAERMMDALEEPAFGRRHSPAGLPQDAERRTVTTEVA